MKTTDSLLGTSPGVQAAIVNNSTVRPSAGPWFVTEAHMALPNSSKSCFEIVSSGNGVADIVAYVGQPGAFPGDKVTGFEKAKRNATLLGAAPELYRSLIQLEFEVSRHESPISPMLLDALDDTRALLQRLL